MDKIDFFWLITQIVGFIGVFFSFAAFQCKKHRNVMIYKTLNEGFFALQYFMLDARAGLTTNFISCIRNLIFARRVEKKKSPLPFQILFSLLFLGFGLWQWEGYKSILVIGAKVVSTVAYGIRDTGKVRLLTLPTSSSWLIYNIFVGSWAGVLCEIFTLTSVITGMIRLDILPKLKKKEVKNP